MADDGLKLGVTAVHASGRRTYDPTSKMRLIERCLQPGASVARLALELERLPDDFIPSVDWHLAGHDRRAVLVTI